MHRLPAIDIPCQNGTFVTRDEPTPHMITWSLQGTPWSTHCRFGHMCNSMYPICHHEEYCPQNAALHLLNPLPLYPRAITHLFHCPHTFATFRMSQGATHHVSSLVNDSCMYDSSPTQFCPQWHHGCLTLLWEHSTTSYKNTVPSIHFWAMSPSLTQLVGLTAHILLGLACTWWQASFLYVPSCLDSSFFFRAE